MADNDAEKIARAIRAALERLHMEDRDDQGPFVSGLNLAGFDSAEEAARAALLHKDKTHDSE